MKTKEIIQLIVAILIFIVAGYLIFIQLAPKKATSATSKTVTIEKVTPIDPDFNQEALSRVTDNSKFRDFYNAPDLKSGLGNSQPFGPLR